MIKWIGWLGAGLLGSLITVSRNAMFKSYGLEWKLDSPVLWAGIFASLMMMLCFAKWFANAPTFFLAWFLGSSFLAIMGFAASLLVFGENLSILNVLGVVLISAGSYLLIFPN